MPMISAGGLWRQSMRRVFRDRAGMAGLAVVMLYLLVAIGAWLGLAGGNWMEIQGLGWEGVSSRHWFGTNIIGQDIFERSIYSTKTAFEVGLVVSIFSTIVGGLLGAVAGLAAGRLADDGISWLMGVVDSIPFFLLAAAIAYALQGSPIGMHVAMIATFWTTTGRLVRAEVIRLKGRDFVRAARSAGVREPTILFRHLIPNTSHVLFVQATIVFVAAIKTEVILSFLGLGIKDGISWGLMIAESTQEVLAGFFNNFLAASVLMCVLVIAYNFLADALQDALDPRRAGR